MRWGQLRQKKIKNAGKGNLVEKVKRKIRRIWVSKLKNTKMYSFFYPSYWHAVLNRKPQLDSYMDYDLYFAARPNPGAGIGHQMANWIAGYWFAKYFGLKFAHIPFSNGKWEDFLGFYQEEEKVENLKKHGYKIRSIPLFNEYNSEDVNRIKAIISSYVGDKVLFIAEQDQFYHDQYGVIKDLQRKFYSAPARKYDKLIYRKDAFNIAIHVRRGDILQGDVQNDPELAKRFQSNDYFVDALKTALEFCNNQENIQIYLFSQGEREQFKEFESFKNMHFCLDMNAQDSFLHMAYADALVTSKSSFSYKPALLNRGIKFCPANFWHGYPKEENWKLLDEKGKVINAS